MGKYYQQKVSDSPYDLQIVYSCISEKEVVPILSFRQDLKLQLSKTIVGRLELLSYFGISRNLQDRQQFTRNFIPLKFE